MLRIALTLAAFSAFVLSACAPSAAPEDAPETEAPASPRALVETSLGDILIELHPDAAPLTVANFIAHVEAKVYDGGSFYRAVRAENERPGVSPMNLIQGGYGRDGFPDAEGIAHEPTSQTGLTHSRGAISMGRFEVGTAASEFFIMVNDYPGLDAGPGTRNPDEAGYAVFGSVVEGMDVVDAIWGQPTSLTNAPADFPFPQFVDDPVEIVAISMVSP